MKLEREERREVENAAKHKGNCRQCKDGATLSHAVSDGSRHALCAKRPLSGSEDSGGHHRRPHGAARVFKKLWKDEALVNLLQKANNVPRMGEPKDYGGVVSFLCSPDASYITGETIVAAGGAISRL